MVSAALWACGKSGWSDQRLSTAPYSLRAMVPAALGASGKQAAQTSGLLTAPLGLRLLFI